MGKPAVEFNDDNSSIFTTSNLTLMNIISKRFYKCFLSVLM